MTVAFPRLESRQPLLSLVPKACPPYLKTMAHTFRHERTLTPDKAPNNRAAGEIALGRQRSAADVNQRA